MKKPICLNFIALSIPLAYEYNGSTPYKKLEGTKISKIFIGPWVVTWPQKPSQDCCHWLVKCSPVPRTATSSRQYKTLETRLQTTHIIFYSHQSISMLHWHQVKKFFPVFWVICKHNWRNISVTQIVCEKSNHVTDILFIIDIEDCNFRKWWQWRILQIIC